MTKKLLIPIIAVIILTLSVIPAFAAQSDSYEVSAVSYSNDYSDDYDDDYSSDRESALPLTRIIICVLLGMGVGFGIILLIASKNKSVRLQRAATEYIRQGSFVLTGSADSFLYKNVSKIPKPKNNN